MENKRNLWATMDHEEAGAPKTTQAYLEFVQKELHTTSVATIAADGKPAIRAIDMMLCDREGLYFLTARGKSFCRELLEQGFLALTAMDSNRMVTLRGKVKQVDHSYIDKMFEENPEMCDLYPGKTRDVLEPFMIYAGEGSYMDLRIKPVVHRAFTLGNSTDVNDQTARYVVNQGCIGCGKCLRVCPQNCIDQLEDGRMFIRQENCLRCGACMEACPVFAIDLIK